MTSEQEVVRDLATIVVPQIGRLIETADPWEPYRLVGDDGTTVEAVSALCVNLM